MERQGPDPAPYQQTVRLIRPRATPADARRTTHEHVAVVPQYPICSTNVLLADHDAVGTERVYPQRIWNETPPEGRSTPLTSGQALWPSSRDERRLAVS